MATVLEDKDEIRDLMTRWDLRWASVGGRETEPAGDARSGV